MSEQFGAPDEVRRMQALTAYDADLQQVVRKHRGGAEDVWLMHRNNMAGLRGSSHLDDQPDAMNVLNGMGESAMLGFREVSNTTERAVTETMNSGWFALRDVMTELERRVVADAKHTLTYSGPLAAQEILNQEPSPLVRAAFDSAVLADITKRSSKNEGVLALDLDHALSIVSPVGCHAVRSVLDGRAHSLAGYIVQQAEGAHSPKLPKLIAMGSQPDVRNAMNAALDGVILMDIHDSMRRRPYQGRTVSGMLAMASCVDARAVFARRLWERRTTDPQDGYSFVDDYITNAEERFRQPDAGTPSGAAGSTKTEAPAAESEDEKLSTPQSPDLSAEAEIIINSAVAKNRQHRWLRDHVEDVQQVIRAVRLRRAEAATAGEKLSDADIYMFFRRGLETGMQAGASTADERAERHFQIIAALMGENWRGTLPIK